MQAANLESLVTCFALGGVELGGLCAWAGSLPAHDEISASARARVMPFGSFGTLPAPSSASARDVRVTPFLDRQALSARTLSSPAFAVAELPLDRHAPEFAFCVLLLPDEPPHAESPAMRTRSSSALEIGTGLPRWMCRM